MAMHIDTHFSFMKRVSCIRLDLLIGRQIGYNIADDLAG